MEKKVCFFYQKGNCNFGDKCNNIHSDAPVNTSKPMNNNFHNNTNKFHNNNNNTGHNNFNNKKPFQNSNPHHNNPINNQNNNFNNHGTNKNNNNSQAKPKGSNICTFFLKPTGCSRNEKCHFIHNYHETLHHVKRETIHETEIVGCAVMSESQFVTASVDGTVNFYKIPPFKCEKSDKLNAKITGLTYINNKLFIFSETNSNQSTLIALVNNQTASIMLNFPIKNLIEVSGVILVYGKNEINFLALSETNNSLSLVSNMKQVITDDTSNINDLLFYPKSNYFFGAHESGSLSAWTPSSAGLSKVAITKIGNSSVNCLCLHMESFLITGLAEGIIQVYNIEQNFANIYTSSSFNSPINKVFITKNFYNEDVFAVNSDNGSISLLKNSFEVFGVIYSKNNAKNCFMFTLNHPQKLPNEGNFLITTDGNEINVNVWCKNINDK